MARLVMFFHETSYAQRRWFYIFWDGGFRSREFHQFLCEARRCGKATADGFLSCLHTLPQWWHEDYRADVLEVDDG